MPLITQLCFEGALSTASRKKTPSMASAACCTSLRAEADRRGAVARARTSWQAVASIALLPPPCPSLLSGLLTRETKKDQNTMEGIGRYEGAAMQAEEWSGGRVRDGDGARREHMTGGGEERWKDEESRAADGTTKIKGVMQRRHEECPSRSSCPIFLLVLVLAPVALRGSLTLLRLLLLPPPNLVS